MPATYTALATQRRQRLRVPSSKLLPAAGRPRAKRVSKDPAARSFVASVWV